MLALIGFIVLVTFGILLLFQAGLIYFAVRLFSGNAEWFPVIVFGSLGGACLWAAVHWSPFSVNWVG